MLRLLRLELLEQRLRRLVQHGDGGDGAAAHVGRHLRHHIGDEVFGPVRQLPGDTAQEGDQVDDEILAELVAVLVHPLEELVHDQVLRTQPRGRAIVLPLGDEVEVCLEVDVGGRERRVRLDADALQEVLVLELEARRVCRQHRLSARREIEGLAHDLGAEELPVSRQAHGEIVEDALPSRLARAADVLVHEAGGFGCELLVLVPVDGRARDAVAEGGL